jgi:hypothetical protein
MTRTEEQSVQLSKWKEVPTIATGEQWNKLPTTGFLIVAEQQMNWGVTP